MHVDEGESQLGIPVREIKGIGEKTEKLLAKLDIETVDQLVHHYPRCYTTYPEPISISEIKTGQRCSIEAEIASPIHLKTVRKLKLCTGLIADVSGQLFVRWFNMPYLRNTLKQGEQWIFTGTPIYKDGRLMLEQPEYCKREKYLQLMETFQPIYPLTTGLSNKTVQKAQAAAFEMYREEEYLPETVRNYYDLEPVNTALREVHFPTGTEHLMEAKKRIIFDEFFRFFSALELVKDREEQALNHYIIPMEEPVKRFVENLPYPLTGAQKKVLNEIRQDFSDTMAMNRLLQGDVGSGKTIVAMTAMYAAVLAGYQAALMAPTEVLAEQHYQNFVKLLSPLGITVALLTGSTKAKEKREIKAACASGEIQILIGTHAVIQDDVAFDNLAFIVTDEQHRFGVKQRDAFMKKGKDPHVLVMSATPIPRTLGIILYRDLDVSIMNEMPASRLPIKNSVVGTSYRPAAWEFIRKFMYVILLIYVPYTILAYFFPLIRIHQDISIIYLFIMLSTICGSLANTTIFALGDRDYLMIRIMLVSPYMNFLGKLIYKIVTEFVFYFITLIILGEPVFNALMLCFVTACARPVGEMMAIITFDHFRSVYENRSVLNGTIMAICVILAYGLPVLNGRIAASWIYAIHPFVVCVMLLVGAGAMYFLWWYKYYRVIIREAMHNKREF